MRDYKKGLESWFEFNQKRYANLQQQVITTREAINQAMVSKQADLESLEVLLKREELLLVKLAEIRLEPSKGSDYSELVGVGELVCDMCRTTIPFGTARRHCTEIANYDICEKCFPTSYHPHPTYIEKYDTPTHRKKIAAENSLAEAIVVAFSSYLDRPFLGVKKETKFVWASYREIFRKAASLGSNLYHEFYLEPQDKVAIHGRNSVEWICADLGCMMVGLVVVPIHHVERDKTNLASIINNCDVKCVFCEEESVELFRELCTTLCPQLYNIVVFPSRGQSTPVSLEPSLGVTQFLDLVGDGTSSEFSIFPLDPEDMVSIIHTSGSTGKPKGVPFFDGAYRRSLLETAVAPVQLALVQFRQLPGFGMFYTLNISKHCSWSRQHRKKIRLKLKKSKILGPRLTIVGCGGAAPSQELLSFLRECFGELALYDGYGSTEAGSIAGRGGYLLSGVQIKLVDVPDLGYFSTDSPFPRGELYVKTKSLVSGYYNNAEDTAKQFVDGWFCTGDIVERLEDRKIRIIDRKKNFFKLAQGEYVAAEKLENFYLASPYVDQIFITCGDIVKFAQNSVFAIVVPHLFLVQKWASEKGILETSALELCKDPRVVAMILESVQKVGIAASLAPYEIPSNLILEPETFTVENGKMTVSNKLARPALERCYKDAINKKLEDSGQSEKHDLWQILEDIFGDNISGGNLSKNSQTSISELGGDSLSAVRLSSVLRKTLNMDIPAHVLLDKSTTIETISNLISAKQSPTSHPPLNQNLYDEISRDLDLLSTRQSSALPSFGDRDIQTVLVTGATGFVGAHLTQHLLLTTTATIICLVRSKVHKSGENFPAFDRLTQIWKEFHIWETLGNNISKLKVVEGNLAVEPNFGINNDEFTTLLNTVDVIFHCGAVVNHALPYSAVRLENVIATKQLIESCSKSTRNSRLMFVSTISCIPYVSPEASQTEILQYPPRIMNLMKSRYVTREMGGYEQSKWVAEQLVAQAIAKQLIFANIIRLGMVGWNSMTGAGNPNDWLYYLFSGILQVGKYPDSAAQFEMLPVNLVSEALAQLGFDCWPNSTVNVCGSKLIPFQTLFSHLANAEKVPFHVWMALVNDQIKASNSQNRKSLEGLLLFSTGLPDERKIRKVIEERGAFVVSSLGEKAAKTYSANEIAMYFKFISASKNMYI